MSNDEECKKVVNENTLDELCIKTDFIECKEDTSETHMKKLEEEKDNNFDSTQEIQPPIQYKLFHTDDKCSLGYILAKYTGKLLFGQNIDFFLKKLKFITESRGRMLKGIFQSNISTTGHFWFQPYDLMTDIEHTTLLTIMSKAIEGSIMARIGGLFNDTIFKTLYSSTQIFGCRIGFNYFRCRLIGEIKECGKMIVQLIDVGKKEIINSEVLLNIELDFMVIPPLIPYCCIFKANCIEKLTIEKRNKIDNILLYEQVVVQLFEPFNSFLNDVYVKIYRENDLLPMNELLTDSELLSTIHPSMKSISFNNMQNYMRLYLSSKYKRISVKTNNLYNTENETQITSCKSKSGYESSSMTHLHKFDVNKLQKLPISSKEKYDSLKKYSNRLFNTLKMIDLEQTTENSSIKSEIQKIMESLPHILDELQPKITEEKKNDSEYSACSLSDSSTDKKEHDNQDDYVLSIRRTMSSQIICKNALYYLSKRSIVCANIFIVRLDPYEIKHMKKFGILPGKYSNKYNLEEGIVIMLFIKTSEEVTTINEIYAILDVVSIPFIYNDYKNYPNLSERWNYTTRVKIIWKFNKNFRLFDAGSAFINDLISRTRTYTCIGDMTSIKQVLLIHLYNTILAHSYTC